jgi:hypothetical protein
MFGGFGLFYGLERLGTGNATEGPGRGGGYRLGELFVGIGDRIGFV